MWTDDDAAKALAFLRWQEAHCPACHEHRDDWHDPETGKTFDDPPKKLVPILCPSCELLHDSTEDDVYKKPGIRPALRWLEHEDLGDHDE